MRSAVVLVTLASSVLGHRHHYHWKHHHGANLTLSYGLTTGTGGIASSSEVGPLTTYLPTTVTATTYVTILETSTVGVDLPGSASAPAGPESTVGECSAGVVSVTYTPTVTVTAGQESPSSVAGSVSVPSDTTIAISSSVASSSTLSEAPASSSSSASVSTVAPASTPSTSTVAVPPSTTEAASSTSSEAAITTTPVESPTTTAEASTTETPATTSTAAAIPTSTAPSIPPALSSKRGILATAGKDQEALTVAFTNSPKISWLCNWYSAPPPNEAAHIAFVPQMYGTGEASSNYKAWNTNAAQAVGRGEKFFLSFGEPVDTLTPQQAVDLFMKELQPYAAQGVQIGSPSVLQPRPDMDWLAEFLPLCEQAGCSISFVGVHWFDHTTAEKPGFPEFKGAVENATALAKGKPVWVDNFQANGTEPDVRAFFDEAIPYLEGNAAVARYAYVSPMRTEPAAGFLNQDGSLSGLGAYYANYAS